MADNTRYLVDCKVLLILLPRYVKRNNIEEKISRVIVFSAKAFSLPSLPFSFYNHYLISLTLDNISIAHRRYLSTPFYYFFESFFSGQTVPTYRQVYTLCLMYSCAYCHETCTYTDKCGYVAL